MPIRLIFGDDVQLMIPRWAGAKVDRVRKHGIRLARLMLYMRKAMNVIANIMDIPDAEDCSAAVMTFTRDGHDFKLSYDRKRKAWILNFAKAPKRQAPRPRRSRARRNGGGGKKAPPSKRARVLRRLHRVYRHLSMTQRELPNVSYKTAHHRFSAAKRAQPSAWWND